MIKLAVTGVVSGVEPGEVGVTGAGANGFEDAAVLLSLPPPPPQPVRAILKITARLNNVLFIVFPKRQSHDIKNMSKNCYLF
ncbi:hypothetical protein [Acinetobacter indicus]|uniref:hypothetical protein n=1 Tax=Acinetobacter indicus TaxID=756892 RepID=UPI0034CD937E